ncbi:MAG: putative oxidoreductase YcjS [Verrucomicrobiota bacterium]|jgi:predicted dehydrogenase
MSQTTLNRRDFLAFSATVAALLAVPGCMTLPKQPRKPRPIAAGAKIRVAQIGCGGKGFSDISAHADEEVVALCDVDWDEKRQRGGANMKKLKEQFPKAKTYTDFRKMLLEMDDQIDAVGVATPDHMHFLPAYMAIMLGKHVYVQKPLTQTVGEARELLRLARLNGVCTQMGNQGHAGEGIRLVREWYGAGLLGEVREVNIWTNRPVWPQGFADWPAADPVPDGFNMDCFLGRAQERPFSKKIHPFNWRGLQDYGCGALGDMACHIMDCAFWNLDLGAPTSVELKKIIDGSKVAFPKSAVVEFQFPARGKQPPVKLTWYEGGLKPDAPKAFAATDTDPARTLAQGGQLLIGSKGTVYDGNDYCNSPRFIPESAHKALVDGGKLPPKTVPRVLDGTPNKANPHKEWTAAIRANNPLAAGSNFEYSVPFTEVVCLGTMAILVGKKFTWDGAAMRTSLPEADKLLYPTYRKGWSINEVVA